MSKSDFRRIEISVKAWDSPADVIHQLLNNGI